MGQLIRKTKQTLYPAFNMISGLLIRVFNPIKKGDFIEINGQVGSVEHTGYKKTILKNMDGEPVEIANTLIYTGELHNLSHKNIVNLDVNVSIEISNNMSLVKQFIRDYLDRNNSLLKTPAPRVFAKRIKDKHVVLGIKAWCTIEKYLEADAETEFSLKEYLASKGISLESEKTPQRNLLTA